MATLSLTYTFADGTTAVAGHVNQNFTDVKNFVNNSVVHKDGSTTMTGQLTLPGSDPSTANHAARKSYVDSAALKRLIGANASMTAAFPGGSVNPQSTQCYWQAASSVVTTNGAGRGSIAFPTAFGTGLLSLVLTNGDGDNVGNNSFHVVAWSNSSFTFYCGVNGSPVRCNWIAIGW